MQIEIKDIQRVNEVYGRRDTAAMAPLDRRPVMDLLAEAPGTDRPRPELYAFLAATIEGLFEDMPPDFTLPPTSHLDEDLRGQLETGVFTLHKQIGRGFSLKMKELNRPGRSSPNSIYHIKNIAGGNYEGMGHVQKIFAAIASYQAQTGFVLPPEDFERLAKQGRRPIFAWTALHFVPNHVLDIAIANDLNPYELEGDLGNPSRLRLGVKEEIFKTLLDLGELWRERPFPLQKGADRLVETWLTEFPECGHTAEDLNATSRTFQAATAARFKTLFDDMELRGAAREYEVARMSVAILEDLPLEAMGTKPSALHFSLKGALDLALRQSDTRQDQTIGCPARFSGALNKWYDFYERNLSKWYAASHALTTQ